MNHLGHTLMYGWDVSAFRIVVKFVDDTLVLTDSTIGTMIIELYIFNKRKKRTKWGKKLISERFGTQLSFDVLSLKDKKMKVITDVWGEYKYQGTAVLCDMNENTLRHR